MCKVSGFEYKPDVLDYLIDQHYKVNNLPFRSCQPRDLLLQVRNLCTYREQPIELTTEAIDRAVENYFSVMG